MKPQRPSSPGVNFIDEGADNGFEPPRGVPPFTRSSLTYDTQNRATGKPPATGASNFRRSANPTGTVTYKYNAANRLISLAEPGRSCPATPTFLNAGKCTGFGHDNSTRPLPPATPTAPKAPLITNPVKPSWERSRRATS